MSTTIRAPSLVGGIPTEADFVPSIVCAVLFGLSLSPYIRRSFDPNTRVQSLGAASIGFSVERVVVWSLRAAVSTKHSPGEKLAVGCLAYQQLSFAIGYLAYILDIKNMAKTVFVNATLEDPRRGSPDRPELRAKMRKVAASLLLPYLVAYILPFVGFSLYEASSTSQVNSDVTFWLRYISAIFALINILYGTAYLLYFRSRIEFLDRDAVDLLCKLALLLAVIPTYRLGVMWSTTSIVNTLPLPPSPLYPPNSLTSTASKVTFYLFQSLPELILAYFIQSANLRRICNTNPHGDWPVSDKDGVLRLREGGVIVDGVGVGEDPTPPKAKWPCCGRRKGCRAEEQEQQNSAASVPMKPLVTESKSSFAESKAFSLV